MKYHSAYNWRVLDTHDLPDDVPALKHLVLEHRRRDQAHLLEIERLKIQLSRLRRWKFGRSSEQLQLQITQLEMSLDPLTSYVATISSAHMLAWLHAAFSHGVEVESYLDLAEGVMSRLPEGRSWVSEVILKPRVTFNARQQVAASAVAHFHDLAQQDCFIDR